MRTLHTRGLVAAGENDVILGSIASWAGTQPHGVIFCHGSADIATDPARDQLELLRGMADVATVYVGDLGGETWGNPTGTARVHAAVTMLRAKWGQAGKVVLVGMSMGHAVACAYALAHPENVAGIAGVIPLVDLRNAYAFAGPSIDAAYVSTKKVDHYWAGGSGLGVPSEKAIPGGPVLDRNRVLFPYLSGEGTVGSQGWGGGGTGADMGTVEAGDGFARRRVRRTFTAEPAAGSIQAIYCGPLNSQRVPVTPGETVQMRMKVRHNFLSTASIAIRAQFYTSAGGVVASPVYGAVSVAPLAIGIPGGAIVVPAGAGLAQVDARMAAPSGGSIGTWWEASEAYLGSSSIVGAYFDGSTPDVFGFNEYVDGPAHNPAQMALNPAIPHALWCATEDPFTPYSVAEAYAAAHPEVELTNLGAWGHTDAAVTAATPAMIAWVSAKLAA